jgi:hypothetical protein
MPSKTDVFIQYLQQQYPGFYEWLATGGQDAITKLAATFGSPTVANLDKFVKSATRTVQYVKWYAAGSPTDATNVGANRIDTYLNYIKQRYSGLWDYLGDDQKARLTKLATDFAKANGQLSISNLRSFAKEIEGTALYGRWYAAGQPPPPTQPDQGGENNVVDTDGDGVPDSPAGSLTITQTNAIAQMTNWLQENDLPSSLLDFIKQEVIADKSFDEIVLDLRQTPEYKLAYPENDLRVANGLSWMPEGQIRAYRDEAKRIAQSMLGINVTNEEIAKLLAKGKSLSEWEQTLATYRSFERYGPAVKVALSQELGYDVSDERVFAFMSPDTPTPELDSAFERARIRTQGGALFGGGLRPEEEAQILQAYGISAEQAFKGYQGIAAELPAAQRFAMIESQINQGTFPGASQALGDTSFATLFRAIQLGDPEAMKKIQDQMSREVARFQAGGGAATSGTVAAGLLSASERGA